MYSFTASGWTTIKDRGPVAAISKDQIPEGIWDPGVLGGEYVEIDGDIYRVTGVEMFRPIISPEHPYSHDFGLGVEPVGTLQAVGIRGRELGDIIVDAFDPIGNWILDHPWIIYMMGIVAIIVIMVGGNNGI